MWVVAGLAGNAAGMLRRYDLRKILWLGGAGRVTAHAEHSRIELDGLDIDGIGYVPGERSMAGFAVDARMHSLALYVLNVCVAAYACLVTGICHREGGNLRNGRSPIVSVLSEGLGDDVAANYEKDHKRDYEESRKPEKMSYILKPIH